MKITLIVIVAWSIAVIATDTPKTQKPYYDGEIICQHSASNTGTKACAVMKNNIWIPASALQIEQAKQKRAVMFISPNSNSGLEPMPDIIPNDKKD